MDILFAHVNFPGQFKNLASALAQNNNRVIFLTEDNHGFSEFEGIEVIKFEPHRKKSENIHEYLMLTEEGILRGQSIIREISKLINNGFNPKFVITHGGNGLGLFIKDYLINTIHIGYFEWFFQPETTQYLVKDFDLNKRLQSNIRNMPILQELNNCDIGVVPTDWQKEQFPEIFRNKLHTIFDGIDTNFFKPLSDGIELNKEITIKNRETQESFNIGKNDKILTYATRGMEPIRGFPEFIRSLPNVMNQIKDLHIYIAGADKRAYSYDAPSANGSWKNYLLKELGDKLDTKRINFTGLLNYEDYKNLLIRSDLHCYLTKPYVTSWSLFEAAACGANLAINKNKATINIVKKDSHHWLDIEDTNKLEESILNALQSKKRKSIIENHYTLNFCLQKWQDFLNSTI